MVQKLFRSARKQSPWSKSGQLWASTHGSLRQAGVWERGSQTTHTALPSRRENLGTEEDTGVDSRPPASSMRSRAADAEEGVSASTGGRMAARGNQGAGGSRRMSTD